MHAGKCYYHKERQTTLQSSQKNKGFAFVFGFNCPVFVSIFEMPFKGKFLSCNNDLSKNKCKEYT